ncbi:CrcB protein [Methylophaga thiooxydans]|uniref:Fluoride-specific ion channel FluC n=2 Tax=Methylophaga thiooxydans TaxID=392484 RepID=C0N5Q6_9GAMM|nr:fluoride efflux transporter CrcB [Methylophaga thiooxydans]EEF79839.1 crcB protein [Methylophaga thiooxydans DMS010]KGM08041.1 CrcB protein [Methylophaga thiooxydans]
MNQLLAIAIGGAVGATLRFIVSTNVHRLLGRDFPYGTLTVNVLGSLLMGFLFIMLVERQISSIELRSGLLFGVLGAFTTFSSFSFETLALLESGDWAKALINVFMSITCCLLATWVGLGIGRQL